MRHRCVTMAAAVALLVVVGACGSESARGGDAGAPGGSGAFPVTIDSAGGKVRLERRPERIVSLSPTATEILFAIDADDQVIAVDDNSNYPREAPTTKLSGFEPNVEAVARYRPDLVVYSDDPGDLAKSLEKLNIPALAQPAADDLADTYAQIEQLGHATGNASEAADLVASMKRDIDAIVESAPEFERAPTYYHELDDTYFTVTSKTFVGDVYSLLGLENIADAADKDNTGYPQLSAEYIIDADPDLIFLADTKCCGQSAETVAERPGWSEITAVQTGSVVELDDDIASRWGPRVVDFLRTVAGALEDLEAEKM
jgi:iron complex transport system substrate-binding protein